MNFLCWFFGHKTTRLNGMSKSALISITSKESGLTIDLDYCSRCGGVFGAHKPTELGVIKKIEELNLNIDTKG
jgi:hypothetical protein